MHRLWQLSVSLDIPLAATNDVHYHIPERRQLQDVLTCIREKCTIHSAGFRLYQNAERYLKPMDEMERLFRQHPEALVTAQQIADACRFSLDSLEYVYPEEITSGGRTPQEELRNAGLAGSQRKNSTITYLLRSPKPSAMNWNLWSVKICGLLPYRL